MCICIYWALLLFILQNHLANILIYNLFDLKIQINRYLNICEKKTFWME